jgi:hypothetical protein
MRRLLLANLTLALAAGPALAKDTALPTMAQQFLKVEPSTWEWFGVVFEKDGQRIAPEFFNVIPSAAIAGSAEAERHARRARVFQGFTVGLNITGAGLIIGSAGVRQANHRWNETAVLVGVGGIISLLVGSMVALGRDREALEAVNSYNYDVVTGTLLQ